MTDNTEAGLVVDDRGVHLLLHATLAAQVHLAHLRMDTPEDEAVRLRLLGLVEAPLRHLGVTPKGGFAAPNPGAATEVGP